MKRNHILLFSGGVDSFIAWFYLHKPDCLYVNLKHRYAEKELKAIKELQVMADMNVFIDNRLNLSDKEELDASILLRNSFLCHVASYYASNIWLITQKGEMSIPDRDLEFMKLETKLLSKLHNRRIAVVTPFDNMYKSQMIKWYLDYGHPVELLYKTIGCFSSTDNHCGDCGSCFRRWISFKANGLDPGYRLTKRIVDNYLTRLDTYDNFRKEEMIRLIGDR